MAEVTAAAADGWWERLTFRLDLPRQGQGQQEGPSVQILDLIIPKTATGVGGLRPTEDFPGNSFLVLWSERDASEG